MLWQKKVHYETAAHSLPYRFDTLTWCGCLLQQSTQELVLAPAELECLSHHLGTARCTTQQRQHQAQHWAHQPHQAVPARSSSSSSQACGSKWSFSSSTAGELECKLSTTLNQGRSVAKIAVPASHYETATSTTSKLTLKPLHEASKSDTRGCQSADLLVQLQCSSQSTTLNMRSSSACVGVPACPCLVLPHGIAGALWEVVECPGRQSATT
jgi:hypothetical protein